MPRIARLGMLASLFASVGAIMAISQSPSGVLADANQPAGPPDPMKTDDIWQIDPLTGALSVKITIPTIPTSHRGKPIPFSLMYNSSSTITLQSDGTGVLIPGSFYLNPPQESYEDFKWSPGTLPNLTVYGPVGPWTTSGPFGYASEDIVSSEVISPSLTLHGCTVYGPYLFSDENGISHDLNQIDQSVYLSPSNPPCAGVAPTLTNILSTDGSGMQSNLSTESGAAGTLPIVLYPDGTQAFASGVLEDSNGNEVSMESDSRGTPPFTTDIPIGQPGQIPVRTYNVTTKSTSGGSEPYKVVFSSVPIGSFSMPHPTSSDMKAPTGCAQPCDINFAIEQPTSGATLSAITEVGLPDGISSYVFSYDPKYGTISKIQFPTGGYVRFVWGVRDDGGGYGQSSMMSTLIVTDAYESTGSGAEAHWSYSFPSYAQSTGLTSTVTAPDGSSTNYTGTPLVFDDVPLFMPNAAPTWKEAESDTYDASGVLLRSVATGYDSGVAMGLPLTVATTYYTKSGGIQQQVNYTHDAYANVTEKDESIYYSCSGSPCAVPSTPPAGWARKTFTNYLWSNPTSGQPSYDYTGAHIVDRPSQIEVTNGTGAKGTLGNPLSIVTFKYDENPLSGSAGIQNHDDTNFPASMKGPRGNLTSETHCISFSGSGCSQWNTAIKHTYDLAGMLISTTDPNLNETTYDYTDVAGKYVNYTPPQPTDAYVTSVTHPQTVNSTGTVNHVDSYTYFFTTGQTASYTDWNNQTTSYAYADPLKLNRISQITLPPTIDGTPGQGSVGSGTTTYTYTNSSGAWTVQKQTSISLNGTNETTLDTYDGLGRLYTTQVTDPDGPTTVTRTYDNMNRLYQITNPERSGTCPAGTAGTTTFAYDALGEKVSQQNPDGSVKQWCYNGVASDGQSNCKSRIGSALGTWVDAQDESGNDWQRTTSALGHLVTVGEPNGSTPAPSMETDYLYSAIGNLTNVTQNGVSGSTARVRSFAYDGLSQLTSATNPESGTVTYGYDANGNLTSKISPQPGSTTAGQTLTMYYCYDQLNRLTYRYRSGGTYCSPTNPFPTTLHGSEFAYDGGVLSGSTVSNPSFQNANGYVSDEQSFQNGVLTFERVSSQYSAVGRLKQEYQSDYPNPSTGARDQNQFTYTYDLNGDMTQWNNGTPVASSTSVPALTFSATYDGVSRLQLLQATNPSSWGGYTWGINNSNFPEYLVNLSSTGCSNGAEPSYNPFNQIWYELAGQTSSTATTGGLTITNNYDTRGRIVSENAVGYNTNGPALYSFGVIAVTGTEQSGDTGTISVTLTDTNPQSQTYGQVLATTPNVTWGASSTTTSIVSALTSKINSAMGGWIAASEDDTEGSVGLSSITTDVNYGIELNVSDTANETPSFAFDFSSLSGGEPGATNNYTVYNYNVPPGGYAPNGNLLAYSDYIMGDWAFQYDTLNRLTVMAPADNVPGTSGGNSYLTTYNFAFALGCYSYDSFGNRLLDVIAWESNDNGCSGYTTSDMSVYNANNQVTTFRQEEDNPPSSKQVTYLVSYDVAGNVLSDGTNNYAYDAEGRLCGISNPLAGTAYGYLYDAGGNRIARGTLSTLSCDPTSNGFKMTNEFLLGPSGNQVTEINNTNTGSWAWAHSNVWAGSSLDATYDWMKNTQNGNWNAALHFQLSDPLGSRRVQTGALGGWQAQFGTLPFGDQYQYYVNTSSQFADDATEHHFTGKERDTESGNDYFGARYYASTMGRFLSPDWAEDPSNVPYATFSDPQSLNLYSYGLNNPLKNRDSDGHSCDPDYTTTNANGDTVVHAGACHLDWWDLPGHAWVGLANLMTARTPKQAATGAGQMFYAYSSALPFAQIGVGLGAADGLVSLGLEADEAAGTAGQGAAVQTGAQSTDVTTGNSVKNWKTDATPDQVGKTLESNGFQKSTTADGSVQYTKGDTQCTMYSKAKSTGGPSMQVKVNGDVVSKVRMK